MAYASIEDVKGRAGALGRAWDETSTPGDADLEIYLAAAAGEIDALIGGQGFAVPITDPVAAAALAGWNADKALLVAIPATWPGGRQNQSAQDALDATAARVAAYETALDKGGLAAIAYLRAQEANAAAGTDNFWSAEMDYSPWIDDINSGAFIDYGGGLFIRGPVGPEYHKNWTRF